MRLQFILRGKLRLTAILSAIWNMANKSDSWAKFERNRFFKPKYTESLWERLRLNCSLFASNIKPPKRVQIVYILLAAVSLFHVKSSCIPEEKKKYKKNLEE